MENARSRLFLSVAPKRSVEIASRLFTKKNNKTETRDRFFPRKKKGKNKADKVGQMALRYGVARGL